MGFSGVLHGQVDCRIFKVARLVDIPVGKVDVTAGVEPGETVGRIEMSGCPPFKFFGVSQSREKVELRRQEVPLVLEFDFNQMTSVLLADLEGLKPRASQDARAEVKEETSKR